MMTKRTMLPPVALALVLSLPGCGEGAPDTTPRTYDADDPNLQYTGRIEWTNPKQPRFSLGATYLTARFRGTGVTVRLKDEHRYGKWRNYYDAIVDGMVVKKIRPEDDVTIVSYPISTDLPYSEHEVTVVKRTEPNVGAGFFFGLEVNGELLPPAARPDRRMLFLGDSITAGSGSEVPDGSPDCLADEWGQPVENADRAYGAEAARALGAEYHVLGVSGIGLVRNYSSMYDQRTLPQVWKLLHPQLENSATWDVGQYVPHVVVVALGTNDFSPGDNPPAMPRERMDPAVWAAAHIAFVSEIRAAFPDAHIVCLSSSMLTDGWPAGFTSLTDQKNALNMVEDHFVTGGDAKVHKLFVSKQSGGCGTHPNVAGHAVNAMELATFVKTILPW